MTPTATRSLRQALQQLEAKRQELDEQISTIQSMLGRSGNARKSRGRATPTRLKTRRPRMSAAAKKAVSKRMKAYWSARRKEKATSKK